MNSIMSVLGLSIIMSFTGGAAQVEPEAYETLVTPIYLTIPAEAIDVGQIIGTLAAPEMRGRLVGTPENEQAAVYIHSLFETLGLSPLEGDSFFHPYEQEIFDIEKSNPRVIVTLDNEMQRELQLGSEFLFRVSSGPVDSVLRVNDDGNWVDSEYPDIEWILRSGSMIPVWRSGLVKDGVVTENPIHATHASPYRIEVREDLLDALTEIGIEEIRLVSEDSRRIETVNNVVGVLEGRDRSRAVVLTAHFDGAGVMGDIQSDGAYDNASGVAAIVYAASLLAEFHGYLEIDVVIAALNGEESGINGAAALVPKLVERYEQLYSINVDTIGAAGTEGYALLAAIDLESHAMIGQGGTNDALVGAFRDIINENGLILFGVFWGHDDSYHFMAQGLPAISLIGMPDKIHTRYDTVEILDVREVRMVGRMLADFILSSGAEMYTN